jgi:hypothetical protein
MVKQFVTAAPAGARAPIHFEIAGPYLDTDDEGNVDVRRTAAGEPAMFVEHFVARRVMPPGALLDLASVIIVDQKTGEQTYNVRAITNFVSVVLLNDDNRARWSSLISDNERGVDLVQLAEAVSYLAEEIAGRPTSP